EARAKAGRVYFTPTADNPDWCRAGEALSPDANDALAFPTRRSYTIRLYKNDRLLEKSGIEATAQSRPQSAWPVFASSETLQLRIDGVNGPLLTITDGDFASFSSAATMASASPSDWALVLNNRVIGATTTAR